MTQTKQESIFVTLDRGTIRVKVDGEYHTFVAPDFIPKEFTDEELDRIVALIGKPALLYHATQDMLTRLRSAYKTAETSDKGTLEEVSGAEHAAKWLPKAPSRPKSELDKTADKLTQMTAEELTAAIEKETDATKIAIYKAILSTK